MSIVRKVLAEFIGTFWLVFAGCGSAVLAAVYMGGDSPKVNLGIGHLGVALAFGLSVLTMAFALGHISGCHLNPAISTGLLVGGRFSVLEFFPYVLAQVAGATAGAGVLYVIGSGQEGWVPGDFACTGFADHSPGKFSFESCLLFEFVATFFFVTVVLGATDSRAPAGFAGIPIGLVLTLIILIGIPVTNVSVNPARSTGPAIYVGGWALQQLWLFWAAPVGGAVLGGIFYRILAGAAPKTA